MSETVVEQTETKPETEAQTKETVEAIKESEAEIQGEIDEAQRAGADKAELDALKAEKEQWAAERQALEQRLSEAEEKARRTVTPPKTKAEKAVEDKPKEAETPKKKARVSASWWGDAAYED